MALIQAIKEGSIKKIKALTEDIRDTEGYRYGERSPLFYAINLERYKIAIYMLKKGVSVDKKIRDVNHYMTILTSLIRKNDSSLILKYVLKKSIFLCIRDKNSSYHCLLLNPVRRELIKLGYNFYIQCVRFDNCNDLITSVQMNYYDSGIDLYLQTLI